MDGIAFVVKSMTFQSILVFILLLISKSSSARLLRFLAQKRKVPPILGVAVAGLQPRPNLLFGFSLKLSQNIHVQYV